MSSDGGSVALIGRRPHHAFLSHAHIDKSHADRLYEWLSNVVGLSVWYDAKNLPIGATIAKALPEAIQNSRALILLLSKDSVQSGWVDKEWEHAINHQTQCRDFRIIPVRVDDVVPPGFLGNYSNISIGADALDADAAAGILRGLFQPATSPDLHWGRDAYVSRGWRDRDSALAEDVCGALRDSNLQLIGDSSDQLSFDEERVTRIMEGCGAFAAILPHRPGKLYNTSEYSLKEWKIAAAQKLPSLIVIDERVELPEEAESWPGVKFSSAQRAAADDLSDLAAGLSEDWRPPAHSPYVFYSSGFDDDTRTSRTAVKQLVEAVAGIPCVLGEYVQGELVQRDILRSIAAATLFLADISAESPNVYIEIGAARVSDVPVSILRHGPPGRPPFMLRDQQVHHYINDAELLGRVVRIAYSHRRSIIASPKP
jgi:hypothetical protein